jgi:amino acid permease
MFNEKIKFIILTIIIFIVSIYTIKPNIFFKPNKKLREYGIGYDNEGYKKTLYNLQFILILLIIVLYYSYKS